VILHRVSQMLVGYRVVEQVDCPKQATSLKVDVSMQKLAKAAEHIW
jgi:hypothetical protein